MFEHIKEDIKKLSSVDFFNKYYLNDNYWYFENVLHYANDELTLNIGKFKQIIGKGFNIPTSQVFLVGSAKLGISLSPPKHNVPAKLFNPFRIEGENPSDLDIAVISEQLFNLYWDAYRNAKYHIRYKNTYYHICIEIYRGFINSKNLCEIDECRKLWLEFIKPCMKQLSNSFYIKNEIGFRIYRNINDFKQYHIQGIESIKRSIYE